MHFISIVALGALVGLVIDLTGEGRDCVPASIPAIHFASQLHGRLPRMVPESIIAAALMAMGVHIIWF